MKGNGMSYCKWIVRSQAFILLVLNGCHPELNVREKEIKYCNYTVMSLKATILCGGNSAVWIKPSCLIAEQEAIIEPCQHWHITDCKESLLRPTVWRHTCSRLWRGETMQWAQEGEQGVHFNSYTMTFVQRVLQQCLQEVRQSCISP